MSIFKNIINAWKSDDLLSQAWEESLSMLILSKKIFEKSIKYLNSGIDIESVKDLKKRDITINDYHKSVRRKLVTHFSMGENSKHIASGFILAEMAVVPPFTSGSVAMPPPYSPSFLCATSWFMMSNIIWLF